MGLVLALFGATNVYAQSTVELPYSITFDSTKPDGTPRKLCNVSKLHSLGWTHKMEIEDGVKALFKWYIEN